jgi:hypothetical protein
MDVRMVDYFAIAVSHGLLALVAWRILFRGDIDQDPPMNDDPAAIEGPARRA